MKIDRETNSFQSAADDGRAVAVHQHRRIFAERPRQRAALLRLDDQKIGVAELVMLIPERRILAHRGAEMEHRHDRFPAMQNGMTAGA